MKLSLVIPCYNEESCIRAFYEEVLKQSLNCEIEFIFVNDGSKDKTLTVLRKLATEDSRIHYVSFSRNFGKEAALLAGLKHASGDYVATLDVDLQHPVSLLKSMLQAVSNGNYDCAAAQRISRQGEPIFRSLLSRLFYFVLNKLSDIETLSGETDYRMMTRQVINAILSLNEVNRFTKGIYAWVGFRTLWLPFENIERVKGETKWSMWKLFKYSIEGLSAFSTLPLQMASVAGLLSCAGALGYLLYVLIKTFLFGDTVPGYPTLVCLILFLGGLQLFSIGLLGNYLAKTYLETKRRPTYIVQEKK